MTMVRIVRTDGTPPWHYSGPIPLSEVSINVKHADRMFGLFQFEFVEPAPRFDVVTYYCGPEDSNHGRDNPKVPFTGLRLHDALRSAADERAPSAYMGWNWRTVVRAAR